MNNNNNKFVRDYSKALANALQDSQESQETSPHQMTLDAYTALCFDDPRVASDRACELLSKALLQKTTKLALSERLVEGVRQATARIQVTKKKKTASQLTINQEADDDEQPTEQTPPELSLLQDTTTATVVGYATLAATLFLELPLLCCRAQTLVEVQHWLGSYRGPPSVPEHNVQERLEALQIKHQQQQEETPQTAQATQHNDEVWADESDPSDFCYESSALDWSAWEPVSVDPQALSQPILSDDWPQLQQAVTNLIQDLRYSKLKPIWNKHIVQQLTQLTLTLLVDTHHTLVQGLQACSVIPLTVLWECVQEDASFLPDYLTLLQSLVAVDASLCQTIPHAPAVAPASLVGLSHLSSLCVHAAVFPQKHRGKIRNSVLECAEDVSHLVERLHTDDWIRLVWWLVPILYLVTNVQEDTGSHYGDARLLSPTEAQWLLNSGLLRQVLLLYCSKKVQSDTEASLLTRQSLLRVVLLASLQSTSLVGKYVWRVPEFHQQVVQETQHGPCGTSRLLWWLLGCQVSGTNATTVRLGSSVMVTVETCHETAHQAWRDLVHTVVSCLAMIRDIRQAGSKPDTEAWKEPLLEFAKFSNYLVSCPALPTIWKRIVTSKEALQIDIQFLQTALTHLPPPPQLKETGKHDDDGIDDDDDAKIKEPRAHRRESLEHEVAMVRKAIKVLGMMFEVQEGIVSSRTVTSKMD
jgi:hypothetical protein